MTMMTDQDHDRGTQDQPETSRDAALEEVRAYDAARRDNLAWMARVPETMRRLSTDPELLASIERRGF